VACSPIDPTDPKGDAGFATAAAAVIALSLSLIVTALVVASLTSLRQAKASFARTRAEVALDGIQLVAMTQIMTQSPPARRLWVINSAIGPVEVLAEPESSKLALARSDQLPRDWLARLGVADPSSLKTALAALDMRQTGMRKVRSARPSAEWGLCAPSLVSPYGAAQEVSLPALRSPDTSDFAWRTAEVWRVRAMSSEGWTDDRIVRLTADPDQPSAIIEREFARRNTRGEPCATLIGNRP